MSTETSHRLRPSVAGESAMAVPETRFGWPAFRAPFFERRLTLLIVDVVILMVSVAAILSARSFLPAAGTIQLEVGRWLVLWLLLWIVLAHLNDLYDVSTSFNRSLAFSRIGMTALLSFVLYAFILFPVRFPVPLAAVFLLTAITVPLLMAWRALYVHVSGLHVLQHRVIIIGSGHRARMIYDLLESRVELNYQVLGCIDDRSAGAERIPADLPRLGTVSEMPAIISRMRPHQIVLASDSGIDKELLQNLLDSQARGVRIKWMPDLYASLLRQVPIRHIDVDWVLHAVQDRALFCRVQLAIKRVMDILLLLLGLPFLGLLLPLIAVAIRLDSPGPIFYRQVRCGRAGKPFEILKFRTMVSDAEADGSPRWAKAGDCRVTRVGNLMRKSRLDELPQLINVWQGDMSFVGPRPERPEFVEMLRHQVPFYDTRMLVKPGLTGWAQVHYDYGSSVEDARVKLQYDFYYIHHWSIWVDCYILFRTVAVVLKLKGT